MSDAVRMQYTGPHSGSISYTINGTAYRAGRFEPFIDAAPDDVEGLEALGVFETVKAAPVQEPVATTPIDQDVTVLFAPDDVVGLSPYEQNEDSDTQFTTVLGEDVANKLRAAGYHFGNIATIHDADLLKVDGVGKATLAKIREAYPV